MASHECITTFFDAWALNDDTARKAAVLASFSENGTYADPRSPDVLSGPDAISDYVAMFSANAPGWSAQVVKSDVIADVARVTVAFGGKGPDGKDMVQHGQYFARIRDDKITEMVGFVGTGAPE